MTSHDLLSHIPSKIQEDSLYSRVESDDDDDPNERRRKK